MVCQTHRQVYFFVTPYISNKIDVLLKKLSEPFSVSTPVGDPILTERVYRDFLVSVNHKSTMDDLIELDMVDFNVILGMDCFIHVIPQLIVGLKQ